MSLAARLILGGALLGAGMLKITDVEQSVIAVRAYDFPLSDALVSLIGHVQPAAEVLLGLVILAGFLTRWSGLVGGVVMCAFIAAIASVWVRGIAIDCGCFTPGGLLTDDQETAYLRDILRDVGFLACAVWLVIFPRSRFSVDAWVGASTVEDGPTSVDGPAVPSGPPAGVG
jgi:uncharacterized membrane protein YphA (DoxX/SURF4 family)